ncbi:MAG TPA: SBBP repeat-containing protein, partial [Phycisphaerae bacterium]|nr:SBBP repeat-containing protein [Phycisphaerae bacterium]
MRLLKRSSSGKPLWEKSFPKVFAPYLHWRPVCPDADGSLYVSFTQYEGLASYDDDVSKICLLKLGSDGSLLWETTYKGLGDFATSTSAMAIDSDSSVYLSGITKRNTTVSELLTLKYDRNGQFLWASKFDGPVEGRSYSGALAVDSDGNVHVFGGIPSAGLYPQAALLEYAGDGSLIWSVIAEASWSGVHVDCDGNTYLTGAADSQTLTVTKYGPTGSFEWTSEYSDDWNTDDYLADSCGDDFGNTYLSSMRVINHNDHGFFYYDDEYLTLKIDSNGSIEWTANFYGPFHDDYPNSIAVDSMGFVYVTGKTETNEGRDDYGTLKYSPEGDLLWSRFYSGTPYGEEFYATVAVDPLGNVLVSGASEGTYTQHDIATVKYDSDGNQVWVDRYDSAGGQADSLSGLAVDGKGSVIVTGNSLGYQTGGNLVTAKYDAYGQLQWVNRDVERSGGGGVSADKRNNYLVCVGPWPVAGVQEFDTTGHALWSAEYQGIHRQSICASSATAADDHDNAFLLGSCVDTHSFVGSLFLLGYDSAGRQQWAQGIGAVGTDLAPRQLLVDGDGNLVMLGATQNGSSGYGFVLSKYGVQGNLLWTTSINDPTANSNSESSFAALDEKNNVYVTLGLTLGIETFKYSKDGVNQWQVHYYGPAHEADWPSGIAAGKDQAVYVTGISVGLVAPYYNCVTLKYDTEGSLLWSNVYAPPSRHNVRSRGILVDAAGAAFVALGNDYSDSLIVKYDSGGTQQWAQPIHAADNGFTVVRFLALDPNGDLIVGGSAFSPQNGEDYLIAKIKVRADGASPGQLPDGTASSKHLAVERKVP